MRSALHPIVRALALCALLSSLAVGSTAFAQQEAAPSRTSTSRTNASRTSVSGARLDGVVNVNQATPEQLQLLPGVGPARAKAIIEYRKSNGAFERIDDLLGVSGIGQRALDRLRPYVVLEGKTTATARSM